MNRLADFYRDAAHRSSGAILIGDPTSAGPMRLLAIHSIELNLSAYLLLQGSSWSEIRKMGHDLTVRLERATARGLVLRERTSAHIRAIARDREYLVARYGPDCLSTASQMNRLLATLEEVARKVSRAVADAPPLQPIPRSDTSSAEGAERRLVTHGPAVGSG
ncbi:hypothetical protein [Sphingomonas sp. 8AM]|uniref:hypothetical protein n=1 Tax=Sphingomonas sp. 8AM TaxID=2653170 RepID=UPI001915E907|nr:hypothetical protein [Sphingomonas sp. 8AM]